MARPQTQTQRTTPNGHTKVIENQTPMDDAMRERVARRAYEIFMARDGQPGDEVQDWLQAERELRLGRQ